MARGVGVAASRRTVEEALRAAVRCMGARTDELSSAIADLQHGQMADLPNDLQTQSEIWRSNRALIAAYLEAIGQGRDVKSLSLPAETVHSVRAMARTGAPLQQVLRLSHVGHGAFLESWDELLETMGLDDPVIAEVRRESHQHSFAFADNLIQNVTAIYEAERPRSLGAIQARRSAVVHRLMTNDYVDIETASREIGYDLRRQHLALILWAVADSDEDTPVGRLNVAASDVLAKLSGSGHLTVQGGRRELWAWAAIPEVPSSEVLSRLAADRRTDGLSVAIGEPGVGLAGFRRSHHEAAHAARLALVAHHPPGSTLLARSTRLASLVGEDIERTRTFVSRQLGELARAGEENARLRAALRVFLDCGGNRQAAADNLFVHPNTVSNRVSAARAVLGSERFSERVELHVALTLAQFFGPAVLQPCVEE